MRCRFTSDSMKLTPSAKCSRSASHPVDRPAACDGCASSSYATGLPVAAQSLGKVERRIVGDRRGVDLVGESPRLQQLLNPRELRDRQRALQRVVAARVEEDDDGGVSAEELVERDRGAVVILEAPSISIGAAAAAKASRPGRTCCRDRSAARSTRRLACRLRSAPRMASMARSTIEQQLSWKAGRAARGAPRPPAARRAHAARARPASRAARGRASCRWTRPRIPRSCRRRPARRDSGCWRSRASRTARTPPSGWGRTAARAPRPPRDRRRSRCRALRARRGARHPTPRCARARAGSSRACERSSPCRAGRRSGDLRAADPSARSRRSGSAASASTSAANSVF